MFPNDIVALSKTVIAELTQRKMMLATAESCTGGLIAAALTAISGSSSAVHGGFVTYANEAKQTMLGVRIETLEAHGAVSEETAREMCLGACTATGADIAIAVTGIAGPGGGSTEKPVGLVYIGCAFADKTTIRKMLFGAIGRNEIRLATVSAALELVLETISSDQP